MKKLETACITLGLVLAAVPAFAAVDTAKVYSSGILVLVFLGICALFVVSQMIPGDYSAGRHYQRAWSETPSREKWPPPNRGEKSPLILGAKTTL